jgi:hypothetical protein
MARVSCGKIVTTLAALFLLVGAGHSARADEEVNLTGTWSADDGGTVYIRQVGTTVWWVGHSPDGWKAATNVFRGTIGEKELTGEWVDTPAGKNEGKGTLTWKLVRRDGKVVELEKIRQDGDGFGAKTLKPKP